MFSYVFFFSVVAVIILHFITLHYEKKSFQKNVKPYDNVGFVWEGKPMKGSVVSVIGENVYVKRGGLTYLLKRNEIYPL